MAWIESHEDIGQHPKTYALYTSLNADLCTCVGVLHLLWHFTLKFAWRDGDLSKFSPSQIAMAVGWTKDPKTLIKALQESGWLDGMVVHDWFHYAGKIIKDRIYNELRRKTASNAAMDRKSTATNITNLTNNTSIASSEATKAKFTPPTAQEVAAYAAEQNFHIDAQKFVDHYAASGWMRGKTKIKDWKACVRTWRHNAIQHPHEKKSIVV